MVQAGARPKYAVEQSVFIKPPSERPKQFELVGDDDIDSPVHGPLVIRGVGSMPEGAMDAFIYSLAVNEHSRETFLVPESGIDA